MSVATEMNGCGAWCRKDDTAQNDGSKAVITLRTSYNTSTSSHKHTLSLSSSSPW
ncbi:hypothetical protein DACRYDRAFT_20417 [Dacryopinax primogenitus]|uniref:Uncharacterized protein n=1 Tax=Dacryopinax primogenitus (strain DJM 731) TaxID=1858805 RepID=M5GDT1_DACPD|nr:uncharacterized protein DACRYDRAFT_20417 [Dacryopinax primogenitus]EJU04802.1 hypothetical protein DACRYDRAFT_20417 [Dacryopinax primogenitus]